MTKITRYRQIPWSKLLRFGYLAALASTLFIVAREFQFDRVTFDSVRWTLVLASIGIGVLTRFWMAWVWRQCIHALAGRSALAYRRVLSVFAESWLSRYFPVKGAWLGHRLLLAQSVGISKGRVVLSSFLETSTQVSASSLLALLVLTGPVANNLSSEIAWVIGLIIGVASLGLLLIPTFPRALDIIGRRFPRLAASADEVRVSLVSASLVFLSQLISATLSGISSLVLLNATTDLVGLDSSLYILGLVALSNLSGIVAFFAPAGIGVREAVLVAGLSPIIGFENSVAFALLARIWSVATDILFAVIGFAWSKLCLAGKSHKE